MSDNKEQDPLVDELYKELLLLVDVKHLNASAILVAITKGMHLAKNLKTATNEQKKIVLLKSLAKLIEESPIDRSAKDDLLWIVDELGPASVELFLTVASKGLGQFKNTGCFPCSKYK